MLSVIMLSVFMMNVIMLSVYAQWHYAAYLHAECYYAECHYIECQYDKCHYAECLFAERRYAECRFAECLGATTNNVYETYDSGIEDPLQCDRTIYIFSYVVSTPSNFFLSFRMNKLVCLSLETRFSQIQACS
jgi:hypothetical protein